MKKVAFASYFAKISSNVEVVAVGPSSKVRYTVLPCFPTVGVEVPGVAVGFISFLNLLTNVASSNVAEPSFTRNKF
ncbi:hypothetical protein D3C75_642810 [compost metagenome]